MRSSSSRLQCWLIRHLKAVTFPSVPFHSSKENHNIEYFSVTQARTAIPQSLLNSILDSWMPAACCDRQGKGIYLADMNIHANRMTIHSYILQYDVDQLGGNSSAEWENQCWGVTQTCLGCFNWICSSRVLQTMFRSNQGTESTLLQHLFQVSTSWNKSSSCVLKLPYSASSHGVSEETSRDSLRSALPVQPKISALGQTWGQTLPTFVARPAKDHRIIE